MMSSVIFRMGWIPQEILEVSQVAFLERAFKFHLCGFTSVSKQWIWFSKFSQRNGWCLSCKTISLQKVYFLCCGFKSCSHNLQSMYIFLNLIVFMKGISCQAWACWLFFFAKMFVNGPYDYISVFVQWCFAFLQPFHLRFCVLRRFWIV